MLEFNMLGILLTDSLTLTYTSSGRTKVPLLNTGIAWTTDKKQRFRNPPGGYTTHFR